ncbi:hypothetical protein [Glutamicibacter creatinolyticus]|uniref:hypothetical protein n=1 Tax=Glutamicibacter creatinolyticus TaxID=162496 RepID=UPI003217D628
MTDPNTGLPELPEGHFWRLKEGEYCTVRLSIRKKRKHFGSKSIISMRVYHNWDGKNMEYRSPALVEGLADENLTPDAIRNTAEHLLEKWHTRDAGRLRYENNVKLMGDYPPKKLEGN